MRRKFSEFWRILTCQSCFFKQFPRLISKDFHNCKRERSQKDQGSAETVSEKLKLWLVGLADMPTKLTSSKDLSFASRFRFAGHK